MRGGGGPRRRASAGKVVSGGGGELRRGLHRHSPAPSLRGCFFRGPLSMRAEEYRVGGRTSGGSERRKGTIYLRANPPLAPVASPWRPSTRARANLPWAGGRRRGDARGRGGGCFYHVAEGCLVPFSGTNQGKNQRPLCQAIELCFKTPLATGCRKPRNNRDKCKDIQINTGLGLITDLKKTGL